MKKPNPKNDCNYEQSGCKNVYMIWTKMGWCLLPSFSLLLLLSSSFPAFLNLSFSSLPKNYEGNGVMCYVGEMVGGRWDKWWR